MNTHQQQQKNQHTDQQEQPPPTFSKITTTQAKKISSLNSPVFLFCLFSANHPPQGPSINSRAPRSMQRCIQTSAIPI
jgi:hypothetical protein